MTWFDCMVIGMLSVSTILAYIRGISRELSTLIALGASVALIFFMSGPINATLGISTNAMLSIITSAGLFCLLFVLWLLFFDTLLVRFLGERRGRIDRFFGAIFGAIRGFVLIGLSFLIIDYYFAEEQRPDSVANATTLRLTMIAGSFLQQIGLETRPAQPDTSDDTPAAPPPNTPAPVPSDTPPPPPPPPQEKTRTGYLLHTHETNEDSVACAVFFSHTSIVQEPFQCL